MKLFKRSTQITFFCLFLVAFTFSICYEVECRDYDSYWCPECKSNQPDSHFPCGGVDDDSYSEDPPVIGPTPSLRDQNMEIAHGYLKNEEYDNSIKYFNEALKYSPNDQEVLDWLRIARVEKELDTALGYLRQKNWDKAILYFNRALEYSPDDISILHSIEEALAGKESEIGLKYFREGDFDKAEHHFKKALKHNPYDSDIKDILRDVGHAKAFARKKEDDKKIEKEVERITEKIQRRLEGLISQLQQNKPSINFQIDSSVVDVRDKNWGPKQTHVKYKNREVAKIQKKRNKLVKEYWMLDQKIRKEKDSIVRYDLINKQTKIKSQIGFLDIKIMDKAEQ